MLVRPVVRMLGAATAWGKAGREPREDGLDARRRQGGDLQEALDDGHRHPRGLGPRERVGVVVHLGDVDGRAAAGARSSRRTTSEPPVPPWTSRIVWPSRSTPARSRATFAWKWLPVTTMMTSAPSTAGASRGVTSSTGAKPWTRPSTSRPPRSRTLAMRRLVDVVQAEPVALKPQVRDERDAAQARTDDRHRTRARVLVHARISFSGRGWRPGEMRQSTTTVSTHGWCFPRSGSRFWPRRPPCW